MSKYQRNIKVICSFCKKTIKTFKSRLNTKRFCSRDCMVLSSRLISNIKRRFYSKINKTNTCWHWTGSKIKGGYGHFYKDGKNKKTHRVAYELEYGPFPENKIVCHHCDKRDCVRPDHLFLGTHKDNMVDMVKKGRSLKGEKHPNAKLSDSEATKVISLYKERNLTQKEIGKIFNVSEGCIYSVLNNNWLHIKK